MVNSQANKYRRGNRQQGAALVEMAIVVSLFLALVFGIIEFALMVFQWSRLVEATRAGARYAIVHDAACSIYEDTNDVNYKCNNPDSGPLVCDDPDDPSKEEIEKFVEVDGDCTVGDPYQLSDAGCKIVERMRGIQPLIYLSEPVPQVVITYRCTDVGFAGLAQKIPSVTVEVNNVPFNFNSPGLLGINASVNMPSFATTRTGEDLDTVN